MSVLLAAGLAAASVAVVVGLPAPRRLPRAGSAVVGQGAADVGARPRTPPVPAAPVVVLLGGVACAAVAGPAAAVLGLVLATLGRRSWVRGQARRADEAERTGAVEALAVLAGELIAGRSPQAALATGASVAVGPFAAILRAAAGSDRVGADAASCLRRAAATSAVPEVLRGLAACWEVCGATGSSLAAAVGRLADGLRAEHAQRSALDAELAGPRATAGLLALLPLAGIALAAALGARPVQVLLHTPVGIACLFAGVGLDLLGLWWTGRLVAAASPR